MDSEFLAKQKEALLAEKKSLEQELGTFAEPDEKIKGDWDTKFPEMSGDEAGNAGEGSLDTEADEVEAYEADLSVEHTLEDRLLQTNKALERVEKGTYGKCASCGEEIPKERLEIKPEAALCMKCEAQEKH